MLAKLSADILDRLDIFILELEELEVPKVISSQTFSEWTSAITNQPNPLVIPQPLVWEYAWCCSLPFVFYGLSSLRRNVIRSMSVFVMGNVVFALLPVLFSLGYYLSDFWQYVSSRSSEGLMLWQVGTGRAATLVRSFSTSRTLS